ncbi:MAG: YqgE/AlgH family protein [Proteobacteria bacterium]|nr:YqgE/AlgH family protein [Pseudomonadota bacterium]MBU1739866.1 YqgE/AlgH family protein [Pseudomonadota bacterium]
MDSLQGNFLIATSQMPDPRFQRQVVYLCSHSLEDGALGLVINHPLPHTLSEIMEGANIPVPEINMPPIYLGGPVEMDAGFFLYSAEYETENFLEVTETLRLSRDIKILWDLSRGVQPHKFMFALGYSGWAPGQLEGELADNGWLVLPGDEEIVFNTPDDRKWDKAASNAGIDITTFGDVTGSA